MKNLNKLKLFTVLLLLLTVLTTNAQITKGNWMVGGDASFSSIENKYIQNGIDQTSNHNSFKLEPNIGYFFTDKCTIGTSFKLYFDNYTTLSSNSYSIGPFVRYYFLKSEKPINILAQVSYHYGSSFPKNGVDSGKSDEYNLKAGPVLFLNNSVAFEFLIEYNSFQSYEANFENNLTTNTFQIGFGLQIHLEK